MPSASTPSTQAAGESHRTKTGEGRRENFQTSMYTYDEGGGVPARRRRRKFDLKAPFSFTPCEPQAFIHSSQSTCMPLLLAGISERMIITQKVRTTYCSPNLARKISPLASALLELDLAHPVKGSLEGLFHTPRSHHYAARGECHPPPRLTIDELEC
jgi:hypothetical protein